MRRSVRVLVLGCALLATAAAPAQAVEAPALRPANLKPEPSTVEGGLWGMSDKAEAYVRASAELNRDPELGRYLREMVCKLSAEYCGELRIYVLDRPVLNASAAPNGYLEINSGLLLRAASGDEVAYVLGHEISHFARNHSLERARSVKRTADTMLVLSIGVGVAAAAASYSQTTTTGTSGVNSISSAAQAVNNLIYLAGIASVFAFSREQEAEADSLGYARAVQAGYDPAAGPAIWRSVLAETQASDFAKVREGDSRATMFASHPITADRIAALEALNGRASARAVKDLAYRRLIRPHLAEWLRDDLRRRDFGQTLYLIGRLEAQGEDLGLLAYFRGEAHRLRRGEGDAPRALDAYRAATAHADAPPEAWRELAEASRKAGDATGARGAYEAYLARSPGAQDRWLVEASLKSLNPKGAE